MNALHCRRFNLAIIDSRVRDTKYLQDVLYSVEASLDQEELKIIRL